MKLGNISLDGTKIHANASKRNKVSYKRLVEIEEQLRQEVEQLIALGQQADEGIQLPSVLSINEELIRREERLNNLAHAHAVIEARMSVLQLKTLPIK